LKKAFYSNGKLLISAEYVVLDGALALALPTKFGQFLDVESTNTNGISWTSFDVDGSIWFEDFISFDSILQKEQFDDSQTVKNTLISILHEANSKNPKTLYNSLGYKVTTRLTFPRSWGLGTSSTLINNIAQWFIIDAFELLNNSFGGSGYDIACAQNNSAILYQLKDSIAKVKVIDFSPNFSQNIYFLYLNKKQNSRNAIANYRKKTVGFLKIIPEINDITKQLAECESLERFSELLVKHEFVLSAILETPTIKDQIFSDFDGAIKSLGAWGGDFVMVVSNKNPKDYFFKKGFETLLSYDEMILT
jgi:mevalonate kinase